MPQAIINSSEFNKTAIISYGSSDGAAKEALERLKQQNKNYNYCCVKAFPFNDSIKDFIANHDKIFIVEQNRDAQMRSLLILDLEIDPKKLISILHYNGNPIHADFIVDAVVKNEQKGVAA